MVIWALLEEQGQMQGLCCEETVTGGWCGVTTAAPPQGDWVWLSQAWTLGPAGGVSSPQEHLDCCKASTWQDRATEGMG